MITVVGCGGDRDKTKRATMAQRAAHGSDRVILTSDNPRSENPASILKDMEQGLDPVEKRKCLSIVDRREAIRTAAALAEAGDIVLVAGKDMNVTRKSKENASPFDDRIELKEAFTPTTDPTLRSHHALPPLHPPSRDLRLAGAGLFSFVSFRAGMSDDLADGGHFVWQAHHRATATEASG